MSRKFKKPDYEATLNTVIQLSEALPENHLARFVVDIVSQLDLSSLYQRYGAIGGEAIAPELLLAMLFYGYATGVFSSRKIERSSYESIPFRYLAGGLHPDHDTNANFRKMFLPEIEGLFVQILLLAAQSGVFKIGNISIDGTKIHADASKSKAISYKRLGELESQLRLEVSALMSTSSQVDEGELVVPEGMVIVDEIALRQTRLANLAKARVVLETRARERDTIERAEYEDKIRQREAKARHSKRKPRGPQPKPPTPGPRDKDQYNFSDPESRIMKNTSDKGVDQHYNAQLAVDQGSLLIIGHSLSNHANDKQEMEPTLDAISPVLGQVTAAALDNGYFSADNIKACSARGIEPYMATGRETHHRSWQAFFSVPATLPLDDASPKVKMAYKLQTAAGRALYRLRKSTVEPVIGNIKEVLGFRQFSLRGLAAVSGEWGLVCLAFNLKRFHGLLNSCA
jgi:transposase